MSARRRVTYAVSTTNAGAGSVTMVVPRADIDALTHAVLTAVNERWGWDVAESAPAFSEGMAALTRAIRAHGAPFVRTVYALGGAEAVRILGRAAAESA